jgi:hypothetical protein
MGQASLGLHKTDVHRIDGGSELPLNRPARPTAGAQITSKPSAQACSARALEEHAERDETPHRPATQEPKTVQDDESPWCNYADAGKPSVGAKIIAREADGASCQQTQQHMFQAGPIDGAWMIKVQLSAASRRQIRTVEIKVIQ